MYRLKKCHYTAYYKDTELLLSCLLFVITGYRPIFDAMKTFAVDSTKTVAVPDLEVSLTIEQGSVC